MTLPTIHMNGTGRETLQRDHDEANARLGYFLEAWGEMTFHSRDYYVQGPDAWPAALEERQEINRKIADIRQYIQEHREHLHA